MLSKILKSRGTQRRKTNNGLQRESHHRRYRLYGLELYTGCVFQCLDLMLTMQRKDVKITVVYTNVMNASDLEGWCHGLGAFYHIYFLKNGINVLG